MPDVGYSGKSLAAKLGWRAEAPVYVFDGPAEYESWVPGVEIRRSAIELDASQVHVFVSWSADLERMIDEIVPLLGRPARLWVSWPKKAAKRPGDLTEQDLRDIILPTGLVDVKVCAVDEVWSGLLFLWRRT